MVGIIVRTRVLGAVLALLLCLAVPLSLAQDTAAEPAEYEGNLTPIPEDLMYPAVVEDGGNLYIMGGLIDDVGGGTPPVTTLYIYEVASNQITRGADIPIGVCWADAAKGVDGRIYLFGGFNNSLGYTGITQIYNITANSWSSGAPAPSDIAGGSAITLGNGTIVVLGTYSAASSPLTTREYDPVADAWIQMADQPVSTGARKAVYWNETSIIAMGGSAPSSTVYSFDPIGNSWTELASMPHASFNGGAAVGSNGAVYYFGGVDGSWADVGTPLSYIQKYDVATDSWSVSTTASLSPARSGFGYAVDEMGRIFAVGGYNGASVVPTVSMIVTTDLVLDELQIVGPTDGSVVSGSVTVSVAWKNPDVGLPVIDLFVDGVFLDSQTAPVDGGTVDFVWNASAVAPGQHVLKASGTLWNGAVRENSVTVTVSAASTNDQLNAIQQQLAVLQAMLDIPGANLTALAMQAAILQAKLDGIIAGLGAAGVTSSTMWAQLNVTFAALQTQLDAFQTQIDRVENKADTASMYGLVTLILVIIVIILAALMVMMARKKP